MSDISLFLLIIVINGQKLWKNLLCFPEGVAKFKNLQVGSEVEEEEFSYLLPITYYLLPITYYLLPITYYLLPITHYLLPITYYR